MTKLEIKLALEGMVRQFAYWSDTAGGYHTGGLSALEEAFEVLGWTDPMPMPDAQCDVEDCRRQYTVGWPSDDGYRKTCPWHHQQGTPKEGVQARQSARANT